FREEMSASDLAALVKDALDFPVPLVAVSKGVWVLELFHGPTLAFKDVGARVQARLLHHFTDGTPLTILVATSGDTGSAVPQVFYYFTMARLEKPPIVSVPSGNFGSLTAGLIAKRLGLAVERFVASTNVNDVVPEYLRTGQYQPRPSIRTVANAMDVGAPSN